MQNAKDSFYLALRDRLAQLNPDRTSVVRGAVRPAVIVRENELPPQDESQDTFVPDAFIVAWGETTVDPSESLPLRSLLCTVRYATRGTRELLGMDRGRVLDAMDRELQAMLLPRSTAKRDATGDAPATLGTNVFWSECEAGSAILKDDQLARTVTLTVFALQEAGER